MTVGLVDYGVGNLGSVSNMLKRLGEPTARVSTAEEVLNSERILLPGVGAFDHAVRELQQRGLFDALQQFAASGRPLLGICLGMQLLLDSSEEGELSGLGLIPGRSVKFEASAHLRVPHMGWNHATPAREDTMFSGVEADARYYFVHSYHTVPTDPAATLAHTDYGQRFSSMLRVNNVIGAQFHPEKSHVFGKTILKNFVAQ